MSETKEPTGQLIQLDPAAINSAEWLAARDEFIKKIKAVTFVDSDEQLKKTGKLQTAASKHVKELEKLRLAVNKPANEYIKDNNAKAKQLVNILDDEIQRLKRLNGDYATKKAAEAEAERQRIAQEESEAARKRQEESERLAKEAAPVTFGGVAVDSIQQVQPELPIQPQPPAQPLPTGRVHTGANSMVEVWDFEIIDTAKIPREFLTVDESKIRSHIKYKKDMNETPEIAGVRFTKRVDVRAR